MSYETEMEQNLKRMIGAAIVKDISGDLYNRCTRIEELVKKAKPYGSFESTQVLAVVVEQWEREQNEDDGK